MAKRLTSVAHALVEPAVFQRQTCSPFDGVGFQLKGLATIQHVTAQLGSLFSSNNGYLALFSVLINTALSFTPQQCHREVVFPRGKGWCVGRGGRGAIPVSHEIAAGQNNHNLFLSCVCEEEREPAARRGARGELPSQPPLTCSTDLLVPRTGDTALENRQFASESNWRLAHQSLWLPGLY